MAPRTTREISGSTLVKERPWESKAVQVLANKLGKDKEIVPMMVEGPVGCILASVGEDQDQKIATEALIRCHKKRLQAAQPPTSRAKLVATKNVDNVSFGAVYEHKVHGVPKFVGVTNIVPEERFRLDRQEHREVDTLLGPRHHGSSEVVWAGVGRGVVGEEQMAHITSSIQDDRSSRQQVKKLGGVKPYSRHG
mmetsp:Transcript_29861/g.41303  ORF Transcript_29861/g.41303 Transcript_29861/m.41303 type:complete len:194 (+) Transcript_29861:546-1127(+)|eukprot:CAMPEP_0196582936 /NCGR_PEP_ID=MMETSP1081-20130531/41324_1 /TAXON_ID=36882 /ORGANISM="Pyramimonas amylifera, Strain CCMP720" /LENGTH=193 /DNA_ID=CAMNT_0041903661 /DNA_START=545 /DNA_END=1126 /DNA_ORIENTATION=+